MLITAYLIIKAQETTISPRPRTSLVSTYIPNSLDKGLQDELGLFHY